MSKNNKKTGQADFRNDGILTEALTGLKNYSTGFNTGCDTLASVSVGSPVKLERHTLDNIYRSSKIYQKIVDLLPEEAGNKNWQLVQDNNRIASRNIQNTYRKLQELEVLDKFVDASKWARIYNNGYIIMGIRDGRLPSEPVDMNNVQEVEFLICRDSDDITPNYGLNAYEIDHYQLYMDNEEISELAELYDEAIVTGILQLHPSRVLPFAGILLPPKAKKDNRGEDDSLLQLVYQDVANYAQSIGAGSQMLVRSGLAVFKMAGLVDYAETQNTDALHGRFRFLNMGLSVFKSMFLDASPDLNESVEYVNQNFSGADKMIDKILDHLVMISGYPRNVLLGSSTVSALSEGSEGDRREFARTVQTYQHKYWRKNAQYLVDLILRSNGVRNLGEIQVKFPSTYTHTEKEIAELRKMYKEIDVAYLNAKILSREEIRMSRFATPEFITEIELRDGSLEAQEEADMEKQQREAEIQNQNSSNA